MYIHFISSLYLTRRRDIFKCVIRIELFEFGDRIKSFLLNLELLIEFY